MTTQVIELDELDAVRASVREHYSERVRNAASCCGSGADACCSDNSSPLYSSEEIALAPEAASVSYGCGNPTAIAALRPGEVVVDLGSGGGIDVFLAAQRVGPDGFVYGVDMTDEMLDLARRNAAKRGLTNVEFRKGYIEAIPLPDASANVIISNCVVNLSPDKPGVLAEAFRVLKPGGRVAISDVVIDGDLGDLPVSEEQVRGALSWAGCVAGALTIEQYRHLLAEAGFSEIDVSVRHRYTLAELGQDSESAASLLPPGVAEKLVGRFTSSNISARRPSKVTIDVARPADFPSIAALLHEVGLPVDGLAEHAPNALAAYEGGQVVGSATLELYGAAALLRSVAVATTHRGQGVGERLVHEALNRAREHGVTQVFLLTSSAGEYFPRFGFQPVERAAVPAAVKQSLEFTVLCPESALAMAVNL
jgi:N-acetylglutamate synthase-like GNAT family acetyltransferase/2-polyprenyl-3-methyl-5-hydroxy-6-metoxy-1,4-benzoquinol methylase